MRAAEARRQASTITSNSMRFSFTGGHVGCTMNTSRPRTFSINSMFTSPSEKRPTYERPSGEVTRDVVSQRRIGIAREQRQRFRIDHLATPSTLVEIWLGWKDSNLRMAGSKPAALPLGDTPTT